MPDELYTSFQASLEEVHHADLVLHVIDLTNPDWLGQKNEVEKVLRQLEVDPGKVVLVFNKIDLREDRESLATQQEAGAIYISAAHALGLAALKEEIFSRYFSDYGAYTVDVADEQQLDALGRWAIVLEKDRVDGGFQARVLCSREKMLQFKERHGGTIR